MCLEFKWLSKCDAMVREGSRKYNDGPMGLCLHRYAYFVCFKWFKAYFGGEAGCDVGTGFVDISNPEGLVCGVCSDVSQVLHSLVDSSDITFIGSYTGQDVPKARYILPGNQVPSLLQRGCLLMWDHSLLQPMSWQLPEIFHYSISRTSSVLSVKRHVLSSPFILYRKMFFQAILTEADMCTARNPGKGNRHSQGWWIY